MAPHKHKTFSTLADTYHSVISSLTIPSWLDRSAYPFTSRYFNANGHRLHYVDEGTGEPVLFVHGTPSWSFDYRNVIQKLKAHYRCVAVDHMGFGLSDKPEHYDYSTRQHSKTLEEFVLAQDLNNITLVVHDFGGPIGLNAALQLHSGACVFTPIIKKLFNIPETVSAS